MIKHSTLSRAEDAEVLRKLGLSPRHYVTVSHKQCVWDSARTNQIKANTDGSLKTNAARVGISFRNSVGDFLEAVVRGMEIGNINWLENSAIIRAMDITAERGMVDLWIELDSSNVVSNFKSNKGHGG